MSLIPRRQGVPDLMSRLWDAERSLADFFDFGGNWPRWNGSSSIPAMNVIEEDKEYRIELAAPGKSREDFKIELDEGVLTISSEQKDEKELKEDNFRRREFSYEAFSRSIQLPDTADLEKINAKYDNGVLRLTVPKREGSREKKKKVVPVS
jgi:HSP20 family protein